MATGFSVIADIRTFDGSVSTSTQVYTPGSGKWAEVQVLACQGTGGNFQLRVEDAVGDIIGGTGVTNTYDIVANTFYDGSGNPVAQLDRIILDENDTLTVDDADYKFRVIEYNGP